MEKHEAERKFHLSDKYYREGRYGQALVLLDALDQEFPNTKRIMWARALSLAKLKRHDEALAVCDQLIALFQYSPAVKLKGRLSPGAEEIPVEIGDIPGLDTTVIKPPTQEAVAAESKLFSKPVLIAGVMVLCFVVVIGIIFALQGIPPTTETARAPAETQAAPEEAPTAEPPVPEGLKQLEDLLGSLVARLLVTVVILTVETVAALYLALLMVGKLPYDEILRDLLSVGLVAIGVGIVGAFITLFCPCIGLLLAPIIVYVILNKLYDIGFTDYLVFMGISLAFGLLDQYVIFPALFSDIGQQIETTLIEDFGEFGEFGGFGAPEELPPALPADDLSGNLLINGTFQGMDGWQPLRNVDMFELPILKTQDNYVYWQRMPESPTRGEVGVSQDLDLDISFAQSLVLSLDVWLDAGSSADASQEQRGGLARVTLDYTDWNGNPQTWDHTFEIGGTGLNTSAVPQAEWSNFLFDLYTAWTDAYGNALPPPARLTQFSVFGEGTNFRGAAGNILLQAF